MRLLLTLLLFLAWVVRVIADDGETGLEVVSGKGIGDMDCGPCAVLNTFRFGDAALTNLAAQLPGLKLSDKVKNLIATYGSKNSSLFYNKPRWTPDNGMWAEDMAPLINDVLKDHGVPLTVSGEYLALKNGETADHHLARVHDLMESSIKAGFPPVLELHTYVAHRKIIHYYWNQSDGHFVTVVRVQPPASGAAGFYMWVADPDSGRVLQTFVYAERNRQFSAITDIQVNRRHSEQDTWTGGYPFLLIMSPELEKTLGTGSAKWYQRTICTVEYLVHR